MKKLFFTLTVAASVLMYTGCKSIPTDDKMYMTSFAIGASAGLVADQLRIDDESRGRVLEIVDIVATVVPKTNETFEVTWGEVAKDYTAKLVEEGKIDAGQAYLIVGGVQLAGRGIDYVFYRYPQARTYASLVSAAVAGGTDGFKTTFRPANGELNVRCADEVTYDAAAYLWIKTKGQADAFK